MIPGHSWLTVTGHGLSVTLILTFSPEKLHTRHHIINENFFFLLTILSLFPHPLATPSHPHLPPQHTHPPLTPHPPPAVMWKYSEVWHVTTKEPLWLHCQQLLTSHTTYRSHRAKDTLYRDIWIQGQLFYTDIRLARKVSKSGNNNIRIRPCDLMKKLKKVCVPPYSLSYHCRLEQNQWLTAWVQWVHMIKKFLAIAAESVQ